MNASADVAVIGAGVAGLGCTLRLRSLRPAAAVTLIEADNVPGGKVQGEEVGDCIVDGGPDLCLESRLAGTHAYAALGLDRELVAINPAGFPTFVRNGEKLSEMSGRIGDGLVTMRRGMHDIVRRMTAAIPAGALCTGDPVTEIEGSGGAWRVSLGSGTVVTARAVVLAVPGHVAERMLKRVAPRLSAAVAGLVYSSMTTVTAAWDASAINHDLRGTGYIEAHSGGGPMYACTWTSSKIPTRSGPGTVLIRGYVRSAEPSAGRDAVSGMKAALAISRDPSWIRSFAWSDAVPAYPEGYRARIAALRSNGGLPEGLAVAGASWDGVGVGDCIASGERAADAVAALVSPPFVVSAV